MSRLFRVFLVLALLTSCSRNPLPPECRDLDGFLDKQARKLVEIQNAMDIPGGASFTEARELAASLLLEQNKILKVCQAEIVARGMDCRQANQASLVSDARMKMRMLANITDREYEALGPRYVKELLRIAIQNASADAPGDLCH